MQSRSCSARAEAKAQKDFARADALRAQIHNLGYTVNDKSGGESEILQNGDHTKPPARSYLILFGSGEIAPSSVDIYRSTFLSFGKRDLTISLLTTPAGFQPNVDRVYGEIKDYLLSSLPDFNLTINILPINTHTEANDEAFLTTIRSSDVLFLGPGSPTYGIRHLKNTKVLQEIIAQVKRGSTLILASAATITFSKNALPVYEIYKVGADLHWVEGLNLYQEIWDEVTIIPHFNNREGGSGLDTSYCYIGKARAEKLLSTLPQSSKVIGIDEHTALVVDLATNESTVRGKGKIYQVK